MSRKKSQIPSSQPLPPESVSEAEAVDFNLQREFNRVEEMILDSPRIPFTRRTLVDEDKLLNQLDFVRMNLPDAFEKAVEVVEQRQQILQEADDYAQDTVQSAQQRAAQMLNEMEIVRRAELEANKIRRQVEHDCESIQRKTLAEVEQLRRQTQQEIEQMRRAAQQELEQMRRQTLAECEEIQNGADRYADAALERIEQQFSEMLKVIRNGRQQIHQNSVHASRKPPGASRTR